MRDLLLWLALCVVVTGCAALAPEPDWVQAMSGRFR